MGFQNISNVVSNAGIARNSTQAVWLEIFHSYLNTNIDGRIELKAQELVGRALNDIKFDTQIFEESQNPIVRRNLPRDSVGHYDGAVWCNFPEMHHTLASSDDSTYPHQDFAEKHMPTNESGQGSALHLITGVSGGGKTKLCYDIGRSLYRLVVTRVKCGKTITPPWDTYRLVVSRMHLSQEEIDVDLFWRTVIGLQTLLILCYVEWAAKVCRAIKHANTSELNVTVKEVLVRCQRNGEIEHAVQMMYLRALADLWETKPWENNIPSFCSVFSDGNAVMERFIKAMGSIRDDAGDYPLVFVDEGQVLLVNDWSDFSLRWKTGKGYTESVSAFFALLECIGQLMHRAQLNFIISGTGVGMAEQTVSEASPVQDRHDHYNLYINLDVARIRTYLEHYFQAPFINLIEDTELQDFTGRPYLASRLLQELGGIFAEKEYLPEKDYVARIIFNAKDKLREHYKFLVNNFWKRETSTSSDERVKDILVGVYAMLTLADHLQLLPIKNEALQSLLGASIWHSRSDAKVVSANDETLLTEAVIAVGDQEVDRKTKERDPVLLRLQSITTGSFAIEAAKGATAEMTISWLLIRRWRELLCIENKDAELVFPNDKALVEKIKNYQNRQKKKEAERKASGKKTEAEKKK